MIWLSVSHIAREYNRTPRQMRNWCANGLLIELGYTIRRDETGHWIVGVPQNIYRDFKTKEEIAEPIS